MLKGEVGIGTSSSFLTLFALRTKLYVGLGDRSCITSAAGLGLNLMHCLTESPIPGRASHGQACNRRPFSTRLVSETVGRLLTLEGGRLRSLWRTVVRSFIVLWQKRSQGPGRVKTGREADTQARDNENTTQTISRGHRLPPSYHSAARDQYACCPCKPVIMQKEMVL